MLGLSFACMYALMYAMVDRFANVVPNINQLGSTPFPRTVGLRV